jgi:hypothetical protein
MGWVKVWVAQGGGGETEGHRLGWEQGHCGSQAPDIHECGLMVPTGPSIVHFLWLQPLWWMRVCLTSSMPVLGLVDWAEGMLASWVRLLERRGW